jgi:hypothetical protein
MKTGRLAAYAVGGLLVFLGVLGLLVEAGKGKLSPTNFNGYLLVTLFLVCGAMILLGVRSGYGGGAWSLVGVLLSAAATARLAVHMHALLQGRHLITPTISFFTTAALWGGGCYCLACGHLRHHRRMPNKPALSNDGPTTPTANSKVTGGPPPVT